MRLPWTKAGATSSGDAAGASGVVVEPESCSSLTLALDRLVRVELPQILDLGSHCGDTAVHLADRGARVTVESFEPAPEGPVGQGAPPTPDQPYRFDQPDQHFQLVLAWELIDFVPPDRLDEFCSELRRVLAPGGWLLLFSQHHAGDAGEAPARPARFRIVGKDALVREPTPGSALRRWVHTTRAIERAISPLSVQALRLRRSQLREFLASKPGRQSTRLHAAPPLVEGDEVAPVRRHAVS